MKDYKIGLKTLCVVCSLVLSGGCAKKESDGLLSGNVSMGPVANATVTIYALNSDGTRGSQVAQTTTDASGNYSFTDKITGAIEVVATGGAYTDEATGASVNLTSTDEIRTFIADAAGGKTVAVSALTTLAAARASENASVGLATAIAAANQEVAGMFGLSGVDISEVLPTDPTKTGASFSVSSSALKIGVMSAVFSQMAADQGLAAADVVKLLKNMAADYSDGRIDGSDTGTGLPVALAVTPATAMTGLSTAVSNFLGGTRNQTGLSSANFGFQFSAFPQ